MSLYQKTETKPVMIGLFLTLIILFVMGFPLYAQVEPLPNTPQDEYRGVSHPVSGIVYLSGKDGLYKSVDNGDFWGTVFTYDSADLERFFGIWFWDEMNGFATRTPRRNSYWSTHDTSAPGIYRTSDGGISWVCMDSTRKFSNVQFVNLDTIFALSEGDVYKSSDGGITWVNVFAGKGITDYSVVDGHFIYALPKHTYEYAWMIYPRIYKSSDCGSSWITIFPKSSNGAKPPHVPWIIDQCFFFAEGKGYAYGDHMVFTENDFESLETYETGVTSESEFSNVSLSKCLRNGFQMAVARGGSYFYPVSTSCDYGRNHYTLDYNLGYYVCDLTACEEDTVFFIITNTEIYRYKGSDFHGVGVTDLKMPKTQIYPQPVSDRFQIKYELPFDRLEVYDMQGRLIFNEDYTGQTEVSVSSASWKNGFYLIKIFSNGNILYNKIIKN